jgi:myosin heavy subunit
MSESRNSFLKNLFESSDVNLNKGKLAYMSVASKFRGQLDELMEKLHSTVSALNFVWFLNVQANP